MFIQPHSMVKQRFPNFRINNENIAIVNEYTYLGHILCDNLTDDLDIFRQRRKLFIQGNSIMRKFSMCTLDVKLKLFQSYCSSMYLPQLWCKYKQGTINKLYIAYHNILKIFIGVSKREHTRPICVHLNIKYCPALIRNYIYKFMCRLLKSKNEFNINIIGTSSFFPV